MFSNCDNQSVKRFVFMALMGLFFVFVLNLFGQSVEAAVQGSWSTQADSYRGRNGQRVTFTFPGGGTISDRLWGSGTYTDDSSIASAAVHAGLISRERGGTVTIEILPGQESYRGSTQNGVTSKGYGSWHGSFRFVDPSRNY